MSTVAEIRKRITYSPQPDGTVWCGIDERDLERIFAICNEVADLQQTLKEVKKFVKLCYEDKLEPDKMYLHGERAKEVLAKIEAGTKE